MTTHYDTATTALARAADGGEIIPTVDRLIVLMLARIADNLEGENND